MRPVSKTTLRGVVDELACFRWKEQELDELVAPKFGIITGFQALLDELEELRAIDLGETGLAGPVYGQHDQ
ncbi:MAG: hypothetical protein OEU36_25170 [Gammaproteobacteria bacterium]|nr:hypothetical protein [Gammaproteobacteria bacterium]